MLPQTLLRDLEAHLETVRQRWEIDRRANLPEVWLPGALSRKYPGGPLPGFGSGFSRRRS